MTITHVRKDTRIPREGLEARLCAWRAWRQGYVPGGPGGKVMCVHLEKSTTKSNSVHVVR